MGMFPSITTRSLSSSQLAVHRPRSMIAAIAANDVNLNIFMSFKNIDVKIYELTRILGILLDNAIEAAIDSNLKIIKIEFKKDVPNNRFLLIVKNSYSKKDIDIDSIFEKGVSSKPNNSGLGLWEVKKILNKVQNLNLYTYKDYTYFTQQIELYNKK